MSQNGRPTKYTDELADTLCEMIADGRSLRSICSDEGMPDKATVFRWLAADDGFATRYAHAREAQADTLFDDMLDIADDARNDWMEKHSSTGELIGLQHNTEHARRSDIRIKTRQWMAAKLAPKKYGERLDLNHSGTIRDATDEHIDNRLAVLLGKAGAAGAAGREGPEDAD